MNNRKSQRSPNFDFDCHTFDKLSTGFDFDLRLGRAVIKGQKKAIVLTYEVCKCLLVELGE